MAAVDVAPMMNILTAPAAAAAPRETLKGGRKRTQAPKPKAPKAPAKAKEPTKKMVKPKEKKPKAAPTHPAWADMIAAAVKALGDKGGSSVAAIKKYILSHYKVDADKVGPFMKRGIQSGIAHGTLVHGKGKGMTGSIKLGAGGNKGKKVAAEKKPAVAKKPKAATGEKKSPAKTPKVKATKPKTKSPKKKTVPKKTTTKKTIATKKPATPKAKGTKKSPKAMKTKTAAPKPKAPKPKKAKAPAAAPASA